MEGTSEKHYRRSIHLKDYDYSQAGAYFITICTYKLEFLFGEVVNGEMHLNETGTIAFNEWIRSASIRQEIALDEFQIMPNHFHAVVFIVGVHGDAPKNVGAEGRPPFYAKHNRAHSRVPLQRTPHSLSSLVAGFKASVTKRINETRGTQGVPVWQRNYWEHVIRNEDSLNRIREYIINNPLRWHLDRNNPDRIGEDDFD